MIILFEIIKIACSLTFSLLFAVAGTSVSKAKEMNGGLSNTLDHFFVYPSDVIDYSVSGSSLIDFNLNFNSDVKNLHIIESLGIPFDKSIIDGLSYFLYKKIISARKYYNN